MSKLPHTITWIVCGPDPNPVTVCVEASAPSRINGAIARGGEPVRVSRVAYGQDHRGRWMDPDAERVLARSIYRRLAEEAPPTAPAIDAEAISVMVTRTCHAYDITEDDILNPRIRRSRVKRARCQLVHELRRDLGLSEKAISEVLRFKNKSCVAYWLRVPYEPMGQAAGTSDGLTTPQFGRQVPITGGFRGMAQISPSHGH